MSGGEEIPLRVAGWPLATERPAHSRHAVTSLPCGGGVRVRRPLRRSSSRCCCRGSRRAGDSSLCGGRASWCQGSRCGCAYWGSPCVLALPILVSCSTTWLPPLSEWCCLQATSVKRKLANHKKILSHQFK